MENNTKTAPEIRFPGFTDPWEQRKLGDMATFSKGKGYSKSDLSGDGNPIILYGRLYTKYETVISEVDTFAEEKDGSVYSSGGEVIVPASGETAEEISIASVVAKSGVLLGGDLNIIFPSEKLDPAFLAISITHGNPHNEMAKLAQGKTVVHLHNDDLKKINLFYPSLEEQKRISDVFKRIDDIITLHQRKCDELKNYKKGLLQQMFPQPGEAFPRVRFPGFTNPWEQRKFKDLFKERREKTTIEDEDTLLSCAITGIYLNSELFGHQRGRSNIGYLKIKMNDLILSAQNLHLGNANVNKRFEHGIISPAYKVYEIIDSNPDFIQAWVKQGSTKKFFLDVTTEGASQCRKNIDWDLLANSSISVPSEKEQEVLGNFISTLDNTITLHQRKCDELKLYKKGLLQKMFV